MRNTLIKRCSGVVHTGAKKFTRGGGQTRKSTMEKLALWICYEGAHYSTAVFSVLCRACVSKYKGVLFFCDVFIQFSVDGRGNRRRETRKRFPVHRSFLGFTLSGYPFFVYGERFKFWILLEYFNINCICFDVMKIKCCKGKFYIFRNLAFSLNASGSRHILHTMIDS